MTSNEPVPGFESFALKNRKVSLPAPPVRMSAPVYPISRSAPAIADQRIVAPEAVEDVVAAAAVEDVVVFIAANAVRTIGADHVGEIAQRVRFRGRLSSSVVDHDLGVSVSTVAAKLDAVYFAGNGRAGPARKAERVDTVAAVEDVVAAAAVDRVVAASAVNDVGAIVSGDGFGQIRTGDVFDALERIVLDDLE